MEMMVLWMSCSCCFLDCPARNLDVEEIDERENVSRVEAFPLPEFTHPIFYLSQP